MQLAVLQIRIRRQGMDPDPDPYIDPQHCECKNMFAFNFLWLLEFQNFRFFSFSSFRNVLVPYPTVQYTIVHGCLVQSLLSRVEAGAEGQDPTPSTPPHL